MGFIVALLLVGLAQGSKTCVSDKIGQYADSCALHTDLSVCEAKLAAMAETRSAVVYRSSDFSDSFAFATTTPDDCYDDLVAEADEAFGHHDAGHSVVFYYQATIGTVQLPRYAVRNDRDLWRAFALAREMGFTLTLQAEVQTLMPTSSPTTTPTSGPTQSPTTVPTQSPTSAPTQTPTESPTSVPTESPIGPLPADAQTSKYFYYKSFGKKNYQEASQFCADQGYTLASIASQSDNDEVLSIVDAAVTLIGGERIAGGAATCGSNDCWRWSNGRPFGYTNWHTNEPNNAAEECLNFYVASGQSHHGKWNDISCTYSAPFVCMIPPTGPTIAASAVAGPFHYYKSQGKVSMQAAEAFCNSQNMNLASIHSAQENDQVLSIVDDAVTHIGGVRIGGSGATCGGSNCWKWTDKSSWSYSNWHTNEPNNSAEECVNFYVASGQGHHGKWNDISCTYNAYFTCRWN